MYCFFEIYLILPTLKTFYSPHSIGQNFGVSLDDDSILFVHADFNFLYWYRNINVNGDYLSCVAHLGGYLSPVIKLPLLVLKQNSISPHNTLYYLLWRIFVNEVEKSREKIEESSVYITVYIIYLSISVSISIYLSIYLSVYIYIYIYEKETEKKT